MYFCYLCCPVLVKVNFAILELSLPWEFRFKCLKLHCRSNGEDTHNKASKVEKLSIKKKGIGSEARAEHMARTVTDLQLLSHADQERQLQKLKKRRLHGREEDVS